MTEQKKANMISYFKTKRKEINYINNLSYEKKVYFECCTCPIVGFCSELHMQGCTRTIEYVANLIKGGIDME